MKDAAGLSYGKHQATDKSDSLDQICLRYIDKRGVHSEEMKLLLDVLELNLSASAPPGSTPDRRGDPVSPIAHRLGSLDP